MKLLAMARSRGPQTVRQRGSRRLVTAGSPFAVVTVLPTSALSMVSRINPHLCVLTDIRRARRRDARRAVESDRGGPAARTCRDLAPQGSGGSVAPASNGRGEAPADVSRLDYLDLIPADFTYRNMDLLLDVGDAKLGDVPGGKPARKLSKLLAPLAAEYDVVFLDCRRPSRWSRRTCCTPPTSSWSR